MIKINLISTLVLGCLFQYGIAMDRMPWQSRINKRDGEILRIAKDWKEVARLKKERAQKQRDAFWDESFGNDNKFKNLDPQLQTYIAQNFLLPMSKMEKERQNYKFCLPLVVKALKPDRIEHVEKRLKEYYSTFKKEYIQKYGKEPNSVAPCIVAYAEPQGELRAIIGKPISTRQACMEYPLNATRLIEPGMDEHDRAKIGKARGIIYSNGSIEWIINPDDHAKIATISAEKKVLAKQLYQEVVQADRALGVQLGKTRMVDDRYNSIFFTDPNNFLSLNGPIMHNFGNVQTMQSKKWKQIVRLTLFTVNALYAGVAYQIFFKNKTYAWGKPLHGMVGMVGLSYVAAGLISATKNLVSGIINF